LIIISILDVLRWLYGGDKTSSIEITLSINKVAATALSLDGKLLLYDAPEFDMGVQRLPLELGRTNSQVMQEIIQSVLSLYQNLL